MKARLFISDIHFGDPTLDSARHLCVLLKSRSFDEIHLVGDIFDIWKVSMQDAIKIAHEFLLQLREQAKRGCTIYYYVGNHDDDIRFLSSIDDIMIVDRIVIRYKGRNIVAIHGHQWDDFFIKKYELSRFIVKLQGWSDKYLGTKWQKWLETWSLAQRSNTIKQTRAEHKAKAIAYAKRQGFNGIIVGHSHAPELDKKGGILYINTGDSVSLHHTCVIIDDHGITLYDYKRRKVLQTMI